MQNPPPGKSSTGLDENIAALLAYIFGWVSGLIFFLIEKDSKLVRFHAMQSILFNVLVLVLAIVLWIIFGVIVVILSQISNAIGAMIGLLGFLVWFVFAIAALGGAILCMVRAYQGKFFKLPFIGDMAEKFANK